MTFGVISGTSHRSSDILHSDTVCQFTHCFEIAEWLQVRSWMCSEMTKRNIQTLLHRLESLNADTHKENHLTGIIHSRMHSCTHTHTHTQTHTHTHTYSRTGGSVFCVQLGSLRLPVYFRRENALTQPFGRLPYFFQVCGRLFRFIIDNITYVSSAVDEYVFR
jgi:hypothetical protein